MRLSRALIGVALALAVAGCASNESDGSAGSPTSEGSDQRYPDVLDVVVEKNGDTYDFTVTISSPYDTPERYADGWRVKDREGTVYGEHTLTHDHASEQPFTRQQTGVEIPPEVDQVIVEGRDKQHGYGGETVTVDLP